MKIDHRIPSTEQLARSQQARSSEVERAARQGGKPVDQDEARLSVDGGKLKSLHAELARLPEVRQERVAELRQAIREGRYQVGNDQIAEAVLRELTHGPLR